MAPQSEESWAEDDVSTVNDVWTVLLSLDEDDQTLLVAHYLYGHSWTAIGEVIGASKGAVGWRIDRALKRAREQLTLQGRLS